QPIRDLRSVLHDSYYEDQRIGVAGEAHVGLSAASPSVSFLDISPGGPGEGGKNQALPSLGRSPGEVAERSEVGDIPPV
ncbi:MAG: hypothetical protein ACC658_14740, partial [Acidimicrobiia bacterium]